MLIDKIVDEIVEDIIEQDVKGDLDLSVGDTLLYPEYGIQIDSPIECAIDELVNQKLNEYIKKMKARCNNE